MPGDASLDRSGVVEVAVVGAGPAGLALARALRTRNIETTVISPDAVWHATYGAWWDDVAACDLGAPLDSLVRGAWPIVRAVGVREHRLERPYVVFDNQRLRSSLGAGVAMINDTVLGASHDLHSTMLHLASGGRITARLVIDATGSGVLLAHRGSATARGSASQNPLVGGAQTSGAQTSGAQTAYGLVVRDAALVESGVFTLMDWRPPKSSNDTSTSRNASETATPPTFFYGARFSDGGELVEETSLYSQPPRDVNELRELLWSRLGRDLTSQAQIVEHVHIPMGLALPSRSTRVVGFGAAAGYVHPVTGYSVAGSLRAAPRVAEAIAAALRDGRQGAALSTAAWQAVWPKHLLRTRAWHQAGLSALRGLPRERVGEFFDEFFSLPVELWSGYLRIDTEPRLVRRAMFVLFARSAWALRLRLAASPGALLRALVAR
ncbi:MAG: lycopene cyclase family protein [Ilumatobacteraceae bacterium]